MLKLTWMPACVMVLSLAISAQTQDDFFLPGAIQELKITLAPADWEKIRTQAYDDRTYYAGTMEWDGIVNPVEIRQKGRTSRNYDKPGLKLKFSKDHRLVDLQEIELKSNVQDPTQVRQAVTMPVFERMGQPYRRQGYFRVTVNGTYVGFYLAIEWVNDDFLKRIFGSKDDDGTLYDFGPDPPYNFEYLGEDPVPYLYNFDPQQPDEPSHKPLINLIRAMNQATDADFMKAVGEYLNWQRFFDYLAVEMYLSEGDGVLGNWGLNNFYFYRLPSAKQFHFIPTDRDTDFASIEDSVFRNVDKNVLVRRAMQVPELKTMYLNSLAKVAAVTGGDQGWLHKTIEWRINMVRNDVYKDPNKRCLWAPCSNQQFEDYSTYTMAFGKLRQDFVMAEIAKAGYRPSALAAVVSEASVTVPLGGTVQISGLRLASASDSSATPVSSLSGTSIWINGYPAGLTAVSANAIAFVVPSSIATGQRTAYVITDAGVGAPFTVNITAR